jgi:hypothetical protein
MMAFSQEQGMKLVLFSVFILLSAKLHAATLKVAVITSEFDKNVTDYFLETNDKNVIDGMRYITYLPNGGIFEDVSIPAERIIKEGAVMVQRDGYEAVRLEVEKFSVTTGGVLKLNYLYSGVTGSRQMKRMNLKAVNGTFKLYDTAGPEINRLFLKANWSRVFGIIGVKEVQTSYVTQETRRLF